ncbi:MAG: universal stress protein [Candidatus Zixiibacteriota bacterium]
MYKRILITLENSATDVAVLTHIRPLLKLTGAAVTLTHVADGFVARNQEQLNLQDSEEMCDDRECLERVRLELASEGFNVEAVLLQGEPAEKIVELANSIGCDLIAMSTHGHKFFGDLVLGSVANKVRHLTDIPVLLVPARKRDRA